MSKDQIIVNEESVTELVMFMRRKEDRIEKLTKEVAHLKEQVAEWQTLAGQYRTLVELYEHRMNAKGGGDGR